MIRSPEDVGELGTVLGIWAHPDDEAYLSGGLMAMAREADSRVVCVTATRGERGTSEPVRWPPARLAVERTKELTRCLGILGVEEHHWLDYEDGQCSTAPAPDAIERLGTLIDSVAPDTVLTFGPDGITGHPDHQTVSAWVTAAFELAALPTARLLHAAVSESRAARWRSIDERLGVYLPGHPVTVPDHRLAVDLVLDEEFRARKVRALAAQATQTSGLLATLGTERYTAWVGDESFVEGTAGSARG